ncbi:hypothetical protein F5144DRAFT_611712 [Chaetomium tenue]|uniref:Uncharacterized protein n=1 Tax=Chaetomium tenue TaxID=1854479 RepID=A0ACB7PGJ0_9PEZI|nr:hypothetical protein F5144DRAFT_611712 [Chaetomium globosum]
MDNSPQIFFSCVFEDHTILKQATKAAILWGREDLEIPLGLPIPPPIIDSLNAIAAGLYGLEQDYVEGRQGPPGYNFERGFAEHVALAKIMFDLNLDGHSAETPFGLHDCVAEVVEKINTGGYTTWDTHFCVCYTSQNRNLGIRVTSRTESSHKEIKSYLLNSTAELRFLATRVEQLIKDQQARYAAAEAEQATRQLEQYWGKRWLGDLRFKIRRKALGLVSQQHQLCHRRVEAFSKLTEEQRRARPPDEDSCTGSFRRQFGLPCSHEIEERLRANEELTIQDTHVHWRLGKDLASGDLYLPILEPLAVVITIVDEPLQAANVIPLNGSLWTRRRSRETSIKDGISKCRHRRRQEDVDGARGLGGLQEDWEEVADGDEASKIE